ncbi:hypothetical protein ACWDKQ_30585 [Saccharopolyspora sp. NPDC000995]
MPAVHEKKLQSARSDQPAAGTPFPARLAELAAAEPDRAALTCEGTTPTRAALESATKNDASAFAPSLPPRPS